ncbi:MAG: hypothetical protein J6Z49_06545 [Kiritimatiellae bacterium]|nr:hypothetical protein [Kiritimatiellia bacterium]
MKIIPSEAAHVRYVQYRDPSGYFTAEIPRGWQVRTGLKPSGKIDLISYAIAIYDPRKPDRELYFNLNDAAGVKSAEARDWHAKSYGANSHFARMPVIPNPTTASFFAAMGPFYGYHHFVMLERFGKNALGGETVLGECVSATSGAKLQGLFHAVIFGTNNYVQRNAFNPRAGKLDVGFWTEYTILSERAPKEEFLEWQPVFDRCLRSIRFTPEFQKQRRDAWRRLIGTSNYIMHTGEVVSGMIMDSYRRRNTINDVLSQQRSDATLGYERVQDIETGEYYRAENGFSDWYRGNRYRPVRDNAGYLQPISGYIRR